MTSWSSAHQLGPATSRRLRPDLRAVAYPQLSDTRLVDWRDYEDRHRAADPAAVAAEVDAAAGTGAVWYLWSGGYRWLDDQCERLAAELGIKFKDSRPSVTVAVVDPTILETPTSCASARREQRRRRSIRPPPGDGTSSPSCRPGWRPGSSSPSGT